MATNTEKLNLKLPSPEDFYNVEDFNENFNKIDAFLDESTQKTDAFFNDAKITKSGGGSVGKEASASTGGALGYQATTSGGAAVGETTTSTSGAAIGYKATTTSGAAVGKEASATLGGAAVGQSASSTDGGAVGKNSKTTTGGAVGNNSSSGGGGAVGNNATTTVGGSVGSGATSGYGFSGGYNAKVTTDSNGSPIDAIQLGAGTNDIPKSLKAYEHMLMDANGKIPAERLPIVTGSYVGTGTATAANPISLTFDFVPKVVIIEGCCVANYGCSKSTAHTTTGQDYPINVLTLWNDKTFSFCGSGLDNIDRTYTYVAIG